MSPVRVVSTTINWILLIALLISIVFLILARVRHSKKATRYAVIACGVILVLLVIAFKFSMHLMHEGVN